MAILPLSLRSPCTSTTWRGLTLGLGAVRLDGIVASLLKGVVVPMGFINLKIYKAQGRPQVQKRLSIVVRQPSHLFPNFSVFKIAQNVFGPGHDPLNILGLPVEETAAQSIYQGHQVDDVIQESLYLAVLYFLAVILDALARFQNRVHEIAEKI